MDADFQAGRAGQEFAAGKGLRLVLSEPLPGAPFPLPKGNRVFFVCDRGFDNAPSPGAHEEFDESTQAILPLGATSLSHHASPINNHTTQNQP